METLIEIRSLLSFLVIFFSEVYSGICYSGIYNYVFYNNIYIYYNNIYIIYDYKFHESFNLFVYLFMAK